MLHLLNYAVHSHLHLQRFLIIHSPTPGLTANAAIVAEAVRKMNLPEPVVQPSVFVRNVSHFPAWYASLPTLLDSFDPVQGVFLLLDSITMQHIIEVFSKSRRFRQGSMYFFATTLSGEMRYADSTNSSAIFRNFYLSLSYPFPSNTKFAAVRAFQRDMAQWRSTLLAPAAADGTAFERSLAAHTASEWNMFAIDGYMVGRAIAATLGRMDPANVTGPAFTEAFFGARMFALEDLVFGPYSEGCVGEQTSDTGACWCNSGARRQFVVGVDPDTGYGVPVADDTGLFERNVATTPIPLTLCAFDSTRLREPLVIPAVRDTDFIAATFAAAELEAPSALSYVTPSAASAKRLSGTLQESGPRRALPSAVVGAAHDALVSGALRVLSAASSQSGATRGALYAVAHDEANVTAASLPAVEDHRFKIFATAFRSPAQWPSRGGPC